MTFDDALGLVYQIISRGIPREDAISNPVIPTEYHSGIRDALRRDDTITLAPARMLKINSEDFGWLNKIDRSKWHYWPKLRDHLLGAKGMSSSNVRSLDESTDRILAQMAPPERSQFDVRGLVLGFVQSGKTSNYTALISKAVDVGYRLIIVLSGIDNGLRRQTQARLKRELVGYSVSRPDAVRMPPMGKQWHELTTDDIHGDFQPGSVNQAALQGSQPVLLVIKKNGHVLRRLLRWLDDAPEEIRQNIPLLIVDDEADQASIDTRGSYQLEDDLLSEDYEEPSVINGLIRDLLQYFQRRCYVAYTATPFANILIPHDNFDPNVAHDLYPKDFIVDLPKPSGYFGAEELLGMRNADGVRGGGLGIYNEIPITDVAALEANASCISLSEAILVFVLSGAARSQRKEGEFPATMLVHVNRLIDEQKKIAAEVSRIFGEYKDAWRYQRSLGIQDQLRTIWEEQFRSLIQRHHPEFDVEFEKLESYISTFFESVQIRVVNSDDGDVLDYEIEPNLKAIAIGGNRLSRGLTLEGLLVSYFIRNTATYDTLMQMGRWFGYRTGYEDLTRIYTTKELKDAFCDLAFVEHRLREDISIYEDLNLTPKQVGLRIWQHPSMQVTSSLKRRYSTDRISAQSYSLTIEQTFKFPLNNPEGLAVLSENNLAKTNELFSELGPPTETKWSDNGPVWTSIPGKRIYEFLKSWQTDDAAQSISVPLMTDYIAAQIENGELINWTLAVRGQQKRNNNLGAVNISGFEINQISRTRLGDTNSLGVITSPGDELIGLTEELEVIALSRVVSRKAINPIARQLRPAEEGLILLYPISRHSGYDEDGSGSRGPLYSDSSAQSAVDLLGMAISFPKSNKPQMSDPYGEAYVEGTVPWREVE
jgi:hypothetical protein